MAVFTLLRRELSKVSPQQGGSADTLSAPGQLVVATAGADVSANGEKFRVGGDVQIDGLLRGPFTGTGLTIGKAGSGAGTGSALTYSSFTTTQRGFLTPAAGMALFSSTLSWFQYYNGTRWGDGALNNNFQATTDPAATNDNTQGYSVGSLWGLTTTPLRLWTALDVTTNAAKWRLLSNDANAQRDVFGQHFFGSRLDYPASGNMTASQVQYTRVWIEAGVTLNTAQGFVNSGAAGHNINIGLYDQATLSSNSGQPRNLLASTGSTAMVSGDNGTYKNIALSAAFTTTTAGYYWVAVITDSGTPHFATSSSFRAGYFDGATNPGLLFENSAAVTLPGTPHTFLASAVNSIAYAAVVE